MAKKRTASKAKRKPLQFNKHDMLGVMSCISLLVYALGLFYISLSDLGLVDAAYAVVLLYTVYKVIYRRKELSVIEWMVSAIVNLLIAVSFVIGFIVGLSVLV